MKPETQARIGLSAAVVASGASVVLLCLSGFNEHDYHTEPPVVQVQPQPVQNPGLTPQNPNQKTNNEEISPTAAIAGFLGISAVVVMVVAAPGSGSTVKRSR